MLEPDFCVVLQSLSTDCSHTGQIRWPYLQNRKIRPSPTMPTCRFERQTSSLLVKRSTNWAIGAWNRWPEIVYQYITGYNPFHSFVSSAIVSTSDLSHIVPFLERFFILRHNLITRRVRLTVVLHVIRWKCYPLLDLCRRISLYNLPATKNQRPSSREANSKVE